MYNLQYIIIFIHIYNIYIDRNNEWEWRLVWLMAVGWSNRARLK